MDTNTGYILHQSADRVVIVTGTGRSSTNAKTGGMLQVWILATRDNPVQAVKSGLDAMVCGDCPHRGTTCYVQVGKAPLGIWKKWSRGGYAFLPKSRYPEVFSGRMVRWGAYGDPFYIPIDIVRWISFFAAGWTGYTHQWRRTDATALKPFVMASVDSEQERIQAARAGWRTFRVRGEGAPLMAGEITCPASKEAGHRTVCADCMLCDGNAFQGVRKDISIQVHGTRKSRFVAQQPLIQISLDNTRMTGMEVL